MAAGVDVQRQINRHCYHDWQPQEMGQLAGVWPDDSSLWKPKYSLHGFLGYVLSPRGAARLWLSLPAGADVDNWYAHRVMSLPTHWLLGQEPAFHAPSRERQRSALPEWIGGDFQSFVAWPNLLGKEGGGVDDSDTHHHRLT
jgi:hypothetical protein